MYTETQHSFRSCMWTVSENDRTLIRVTGASCPQGFTGHSGTTLSSTEHLLRSYGAFAENHGHLMVMRNETEISLDGIANAISVARETPVFQTQPTEERVLYGPQLASPDAAFGELNARSDLPVAPVSPAE